MLIHSVRATNVLKYARLELTDIPEKGLIAISGANESGKTAIVETICFALFGRTFSLPPEEIVKCIRWGETACSVELEFSADEDRYRVARSLGGDGIQGATLTRVGEPEAIATGARAVYDAVVEVGGFSFQQYLDSLYLAQREISAPHSQSDTIKAVAGGVELERVAAEIEADVLEVRRTIERIRDEAGGLEGQIAAMGIRDDAIAELEQEKADFEAHIAANEKEMEGLRNSSDAFSSGCGRIKEIGNGVLEATTGTSLGKWREFSQRLSGALKAVGEICQTLETDTPLCVNEGLKGFVWEFEGRLAALDAVRGRARQIRADLGWQLGEPDTHGPSGEDPLPQRQAVVEQELRRARRWRFLARFNFLLLLAATVGAWGLWAALVKAPGSQAGKTLSDWLPTYVPVWNDAWSAWLFPGAAALSVLTLILLFRALRLTARVRGVQSRHADLGRLIEVARHRAELLDYMEGMAFPKALESLDELEDEILSRLVSEFQAGPGRALLEDEALGKLQRRLYGLLQDCEVNLHEARELIAATIGGLENEDENSRREMVRRDEAVVRERERLRQAGEMRHAIEVLHSTIPQHEQRIALLELAKELVRGTCQELYSRFNRVLRRYTGEVMPKLTDQRYQHMQIDDDLTVRVFSSEKNDFATVGELSSGTQRQFMLAVRLAMAKALSEAAVQGRQFVILDEPFAFFDRDRIRSTLEALPAIDDKMCQTWIIAQEFETDDPFTLHLNCSRVTDEMVQEAVAG